MYLNHKEWLKVGILLEELRGLFEELSDEELDGLKKIVIQEQKRCSDRSVSEGTQPTHTNVRG